MKFDVIGAALFLAGIGIPLMLPNQFWVGALFCLAAAAVLIVGHRRELLCMRFSMSAYNIGLAALVAAAFGGAGYLLKRDAGTPIPSPIAATAPSSTTVPGQSACSLVTAKIEKITGGDGSDGHPALVVLATVRNESGRRVLAEGYRLEVTLASGSTALLNPAPIDGRVCFSTAEGEHVEGLEVNPNTALDNKTIRGVDLLERGFLRFPSKELTKEALFAKGGNAILTFDTFDHARCRSAPYVMSEPVPMGPKLQLYCPGVQ